MQYKLLEQEDIPLMREVLEDDDMIYNVNHLTEFITNPNTFGFICKQENYIVGFAYAYSLIRPDGKTMFYLHSIGILPKYQNLGYGTEFLTYIKEYSKSLGCSEMFVITDKGNSRACHVYEKIGGKNDYENEIVYVYNYEK